MPKFKVGGKMIKAKYPKRSGKGKSYTYGKKKKSKKK
tara:strand:- start:4149 stop:4259 length:111 start_codon:yes stop_codon:yes gene_type:complete